MDDHLVRSGGTPKASAPRRPRTPCSSVALSRRDAGTHPPSDAAAPRRGDRAGRSADAPSNPPDAVTRPRDLRRGPRQALVDRRVLAVGREDLGAAARLLDEAVPATTSLLVREREPRPAPHRLEARGGPPRRSSPAPPCARRPREDSSTRPRPRSVRSPGGRGPGASAASSSASAVKRALARQASASGRPRDGGPPGRHAEPVTCAASVERLPPDRARRTEHDDAGHASSGGSIPSVPRYRAARAGPPSVASVPSRTRARGAAPRALGMGPGRRG